jgi:hypothetical protein
MIAVLTAAASRLDNRRRWSVESLEAAAETAVLLRQGLVVRTVHDGCKSKDWRPEALSPVGEAGVSMTKGGAVFSLSVRPPRPVTPEVAGSSPVGPDARRTARV